MSWYGNNGDGDGDGGGGGRGGGGNPEEEEEELPESEYNTQTDRIIFVIDGRLAMQQAKVRRQPKAGAATSARDVNNKSNMDDGGYDDYDFDGSDGGGAGGGGAAADDEENLESQLHHCLRFAMNLMKAKIISGNSNMGVVVIGARIKENGFAVGEQKRGKHGVNTLIPLAPPSANSIRELDKLVSSPTLAFESDFGDAVSAENWDFPLESALALCVKAFKDDVGTSKARQATVSSRLWLFTNDDDPLHAKANSPDRADRMNVMITRCRDMAMDPKMKLDLSLWALQKEVGGPPFDIARYYRPILEEFDKTLQVEDGNEDGSISDDFGALSLYDGDEPFYTKEEALAERVSFADGLNGFDLTSTNFRRKGFKKRILSRSFWSLGGGSGGSDVGLALKLYKTVQIATTPISACTLDAKTNEVLSSSTRMIVDNTGSVATKDIGNYLKVGDNISFPVEKDVYQKIRISGHMKAAASAAAEAQAPSMLAIADSNSSSSSIFAVNNSNSNSNSNSTAAVIPVLPAAAKAIPISIGSIKTLYMTPLENIRPGFGLNIGSPTFLFPDEASITGSMELFKMLLDELWEKKLAAVVSRVRSRGSVPDLAAIFAERESYLDGGFDVDGDSTAPIGLYMIPLPFAEDIRRSATSDVVLGGGEDEDKIHESGVIKGLLRQAVASMADTNAPLNYASQINNPLLQLYYSTLQAIAIGDPPEWDPATQDSLVVRGSIRQTTDRDVWTEIQEKMGLTAEALEAERADKATPAQKKRAAAAAGGSGGGGGAERKNKRAKKGEDDDGDDEDDAADAAGGETIDDIEIGQLQFQKNDYLKDLCRKFGLPVSGTKDVLIGRISDLKSKSSM